MHKCTIASLPLLTILFGVGKHLIINKILIYLAIGLGFTF